MILKQTSTKLMIKEKAPQALMRWVGGIIYILIGISSISLSFKGFLEINLASKYMILIGLIFIIAGILIIEMNAVNMWTFDKNQNTLTQNIKGLFLKKAKYYQITDIVDIQLKEDIIPAIISLSPPNYGVVMVLANGKTVNFTRWYTHGNLDKEALVDFIYKFLN
jgi:hypothetical protein